MEFNSEYSLSEIQILSLNLAYNFRKCLLHQRIKNEPKENIDFVLKEIYEIFYDFFSSNDFKIIITKSVFSLQAER